MWVCYLDLRKRVFAASEKGKFTYELANIFCDNPQIFLDQNASVKMTALQLRIKQRRK